MLDGVAAQFGAELRIIHTDLDQGISRAALTGAVGPDTALVSLSHVAYRSGALAEPGRAHRTGARRGRAGPLGPVPLSGAVPVELDASAADLAVGCSYKYLNGETGRACLLSSQADLQDRLRQPIQGWFGQRGQFEMGPAWRLRCPRWPGSPPGRRTSSARWRCRKEGPRLLGEAGIQALRDKGILLTSYLIGLADAWLAPLGCVLATPRDPLRRGSHVSLRHPEAWRISQALIRAGVIGDYRVPDRLRLGLAPIYTRFTDLWDALDILRQVIETQAYADLPAGGANVT